MAAFATLAVGTGGAVADSAAPAATASAPAPSSPGMFVATTPARVLDTRRAVGTARPGARSSVAVQVTGRGGVPSSGVGAVVFTLTAVTPASSGYVTTYPDGTTQPVTSSLNFARGRTVANLVTVPVGATGKIDLYNGSTTPTDLLGDVAGYYLAGTPHDAGGFTAVTPTRVLDTRSAPGAMKPGKTGGLSLLGDGPVPTHNVSAVVLNLTVAAPTAAGHLTVWADGHDRPATSVLNFERGQTVADQVTVPVGPNGDIQIYNGSAGATHVLGDVLGYYLAGTPRDPGAFVATDPARIVDTRTGTGGAPLAPAGTATFPLAGHGPVPVSGVSAALLTVTAVAPTAPGHLTLYPGDTTRPTTSAVAFDRSTTVAGAGVVPLGAPGTVAAYNGSSGTTQLLADVAGYFLTGPTSEVAPNVPASFTLSPVPIVNGTPRCNTLGTSLRNVGDGLGLTAWVSDPNGPRDSVRAHITLDDRGGDSQGTPTPVIGPEDPRGLSSAVSGAGAFVTVNVPGDLLADGHVYSVDVVASDGMLDGPRAGACGFRYDSTPPVANLKTTATSFHVGQPFSLGLNGSDPAPAIGTASGLDHLAFSTVSATVVSNDGGTHYGPGDSVLIYPDSPGRHYAYLTATDRAGNRSTVDTFEYDVQG